MKVESASTTQPAQPTPSQMSKSSFFRQSGWMVITTVVSGLAMYGVHPFSKKIPESEYGVLGLLLAFLNCMSIPSLGLQMMFVQQTAAALTEGDKRCLAGVARKVLLGTFIIWLMMAGGVFLIQNDILTRWQISNPLALWLTMLVGFCALWTPVFGGILHGQQNFFWYGWSSMLNGIGRVTGVAVIVLVFHGYAAGMVGGILAGTVVMLGIFIWQTRSVWTAPSAPFLWKPWLARVIPLTFGFGSFVVMFSADPLFVQAYFDKEQTGFYTAAGTVSRALVAFTGPVVQVMFPKIVRSAATREKSDVLWLTLLISAGMAIFGALCLSLLGSVLLWIVYKDSYQAAVPLLHWFPWGMVPLALANVLLQNLLARSHFKVVPWVTAVAVSYCLALTQFHGSFLSVIWTIGASTLLYFAVTLWFTWRTPGARDEQIPTA